MRYAGLEFEFETEVDTVEYQLHLFINDNDKNT